MSSSIISSVISSSIVSLTRRMNDALFSKAGVLVLSGVVLLMLVLLRALLL
jgi:hypothetical protein